MMNVNEQYKIDIQQDWIGIQKLKEHDNSIMHLPNGDAILTGGFVPESFWNLPFLLAYSVLDDVLTILRNEGAYTCSSRESQKLGLKMEASKSQITWQNYDLVSEGKDARNDLAHRAVIWPKEKCFTYIDAIEKELAAWGLL
jgi:hypothetical protein